MDNTAAAPVKFALEDARRIVGELAEMIRPACDRLEVAGSIRRGEPYVKDAELVAIPQNNRADNLWQFVGNLVDQAVIEKAVYRDKNGKETLRWGPLYRGMLFQGIKVELFLTHPDSWGYQKWLRSGPGDANHYIMGYLIHKHAPIRFVDGDGWWSPGNRWQKPKDKWIADDKQRLNIPDEDTLFAVLGMPYLPPNERSERKYKTLLAWNRAHHWPEYAPFAVKVPTPVSLFEVERPDEAVETRRTVSVAGSLGLMSSQAFLAYRREQARVDALARLPGLESRSADLYAQYQAERRKISQAKTNHAKRELENRLYAEDGIAWQWARVDSQLVMARQAAR